MTYPPAARAGVAYAVAARETADRCYALVERVGDREATSLADRASEVREVRSASALVFQRFIVMELLAGQSWADVAAAVGFNETTLRAQYEDVIEAWLGDQTAVDPDRFGDFTVGLRDDHDPLGTARSLDQWLARHREPWDTTAEHPVVRALTAGA